MGQKKITDLTLRSSFDATCNFPIDDTAQTWRVTGAQVLAFLLGTDLTNYVKAQIPPTTQSYDITNLTLTTAVGGNALTISVKTKAGTDPSAADPITVGIRSATLASGIYNKRTISSALSMIVSSGSTLGQVDTKPSNIYVYLIDNSGNLELAVSHAYYPEDALVSTTAEGGAGAADSATTIYSTTARSNVPIRLVGTILNTQSVAGTWGSAGTQIQLSPVDNFKVPSIQKFTSGSGIYYTPAGVKYLRVRMVGGGGGGGGGGVSGGTGNGTAGGSTTFGTSLLVANGGGGGFSTGVAAGGTASLGTGPIGTAIQGGSAMGITALAGNGFFPAGSPGASSPFGGSGAGFANGAGTSAIANSGSGGGGGGCNQVAGTVNYGGAGGAAGGFVDAIINLPAASYNFQIGSGGAGGGAGSNGYAAGAGGSGYIEVTEYYQ